MERLHQCCFRKLAEHEKSNFVLINFNDCFALSRKKERRKAVCHSPFCEYLYEVLFISCGGTVPFFLSVHYFAIVLDEYGGTSGIVTDRDIYEELFGTVKDEADDVSLEDIIDNGDGTYKVSGKTTLYDFERYFKFRDKDFQESESVTIAGYLLENYKVKLSSVITIGQFDIKITEFNRNYIEWLEVSHHQEEKE